MKKTFYTLLLSIAVITVAQLSYAQSPYKLNQVIVLNQGYYDYTTSASVHPVSIGSYDPVAKSYTTFDSIPGLRFSTVVLIDSGYIYAAADTLLLKYDLSTKQKLATQSVHGIREIAVWHNQLLVTRGDVGPLTSYFQAFNKKTLAPLYQLPSVSAATEGIKVLNDTAYIAINGFYGGVGKLGVIDLKNETENREIDLGSSAYNPYDVEVEKSNNTIYTINNLNYDSTSITRYTPSTGTLVTKVVNLTSDCNGSTYFASNIYYQTFGATNIQVLSTSGFSVWDSLPINKSIVALAPDTVNGNIYAGNTDYRSYGKVFAFNLYGGAIDSFSAGITPGGFAFDVSTATGVEPVSSFANLQLYPNPANNELHVIMYDNKDAQATLTLMDMLGRAVYQKQIITNSLHLVPMSSLTSGIYFLKVETTNGELTKKIVKE